MILSPLTKRSNIQKEFSIAVSEIIQAYKKIYNIDVTSFFKGIQEVSLYKCLDSNYTFFHPFSIAGDGKFYEELQQHDWYYMPWKWEHDYTYACLQKNDKILEVGSGGNGFVERLSEEGYDIVGLELNEDSVASAKTKGLRVYKETVQEHALKNKERYDIVCSFQVLEHIVDVESFIQGKIDCLKPGGKLIICVPNNDSFIKFTPNFLNMPPHHMGLWNVTALSRLTALFDIELSDIIQEPLQDYHVQWYKNNLYNRLSSNRYIRKVIRLLSESNLEQSIKVDPTAIIGHSVIAVYTKS